MHSRSPWRISSAGSLAENGLMAAPVRFTDGALHALIRGYTREAGGARPWVALRRAEGVLALSPATAGEASRS